MMPPTMRKTQLIGWLRNAAIRVRLGAAANGGWTAIARWLEATDI